MLTVYEPEAGIVRNIFALYLQGFSTSEIARELNKLNIPTKAGKEIWRPSRVAYILKNERYIGDSFYQKTYRETTVPFNQHPNEGGRPVTFGAFISTRRKEAKLNLRDTAKHLGISNGYLCDIEQGRRPAPEGAFVERISSFLELDKQEHEMLLDLAADSRQTVPADLPDYIRQHDIVRAALRVAKEVDATDEEWKAFMEMLQNRQN